MKGSRRRLGIAGIIVVGVLAVPASALASFVNIGATYTGAACCGPGTVYIVWKTGTTSPAYTVPADAFKLTGFRIEGNTATTAQEALVVFRKTATAGTYTVVGQSATESLAASKLNSFPVNLNVHPGDILGLKNVSAKGTEPMFKAGFTGTVDQLNAATGTVTTGSTFSFPAANASPAGFRLNIAATVQLRPIVSSISPTSGPGGTLVTINGSHFTKASKVYFGTSAHPGTNLTVVSDTKITVNAPTGVASGTAVDVRVLTPGGLSPTSTSDRFSFS